MTWQQWVLIATFVSSALVNVGQVGRPRKPIAPAEAVFSVAFAALLVALVVTL